MALICDAKHFGVLSEARSSAFSEAQDIVEPVAEERFLAPKKRNFVPRSAAKCFASHIIAYAVEEPACHSAHTDATPKNKFGPEFPPARLVVLKPRN